jgi:cell division initiation protein
MNLTPADIRKKEFRRLLRGYEIRDVREFLYEVAAELESTNSEKDLLKLKISDLEETVKEFRKMEQVLKDTLSQGQGTAELLRRNALEDSEKIREGAKNDAEKLRYSVQLEIEKLQADIRTLHGQKQAFLAEMEGLLDNYGRILERLKKETQIDETAD